MVVTMTSTVRFLLCKVCFLFSLIQRGYVHLIQTSNDTHPVKTLSFFRATVYATDS